MSVATVSALVDLLRQHRLLEGLQLDEAARLQAHHVDPRSLAKELLQRGWLTPYQVNQILTGKVQDLVLGSYILLERLGEGGMGQVFKARQPRLNRLVAIKVIRKERMTNAEAVKRFQREMRAASSLDHPNIVKAVDADQVGDNLILAMEYVEGIDLSKRVKQSGPLPVDEAVEYMRQAGHGLQHASDRGLVHRDIKPANLLVTKPTDGSPWGTLRILDMGLARIIRPEDSDDDDTSSGTITQEGFVMGTLDFLAPEQAQDSHRVDIRADLYALGCTFYFILSGQVPFPGGSPPEKLLKHRLDDPTPIEQLRPEVPGSVSAVVRCLMAKKPADRYQTPEALALALADIRAGVPVAIPVPPAAIGATIADPYLPAPQSFALDATSSDTPMAMPVADTESPLPRVKGKSVPAKQKLLLAAGIAGGVFLVFAVALLALFSGSRTPTTATQQAKETKTERKPSPLDQLDRKLIPAGELAVYQPQELVAVVGQHKNGAWNQSVERRRHAGPVHAVAFSPNGKQIASGGADNVIRIWDPKLPRPIGTLAGHRGAVMSIAYSTDGNRLVSGSMANDVLLWDVANGKPIQQFQGHTDGVQAVAISPDGQHVMSGGRDKTVRLWDVASGKELWKSDAHNETVWAVGFSPDGQQALSGSRDKTARLWDVESGKELQQLTGHASCIHTVAFLPGGRQGLTGSCDRTLRLWDLPSGKLIRRYTGHQGQIDSVKLTSDGQQALTGSWDKTLRLWNVGTAAEVRQFLGHEDMVWSAALSPDGKRAVSGSGGVNQEGRIQPGIDNTVRLWDVASGSELIPFEGATGPFYGVDFTPDGKQLITAGADGLIRVWDLLLMKEVRRLEGHRNQVWDVACSPDGKYALSGSEDRTVRLWDLTQGTELKRFEERSRPVHRVVFGPDGRRALASGDASLWVWDVHTGQELGRFKGHTDTILCVDWKGTRAVSGSADKSVRIWNTDTGQEVNRFDGHNSSVLSAALSPDARWAASGGADQSIRVYDLKTNTIARRFDCAGPVTGLAFSPNSLVLASSDLKGVITLRDLNGNKLKEWTLPGPVQRVAWSEDGRHLACANQNGTAYVLRYDTSAVAAPR